MQFIFIVYLDDNASSVKTKQSTSWSAIFTRKSVSFSDPSIPKKSKKISTASSTYMCLKCGSELSHGKPSYKLRHWEQMHKGDDPNLAHVFIVPSDHEDAQKKKKSMQIKCNVKQKERSTSAAKKQKHALHWLHLQMKLLPPKNRHWKKLEKFKKHFRKFSIPILQKKLLLIRLKQI